MTVQADKFLCALLLSDLDDSVSLERVSLRRAGVTRVRSLREGRKALEVLEQQCNLEGGEAAFAGQERIDVVVCADRLADMNAGAFLRAFASLRNKVKQQYDAEIELLPPVLVISANMLTRDDFIAQGAAAVMARPYTISSLAGSIQGLMSVGTCTGSRFAPADSFFSKLQKKAQQKLAPLAEQSALSERPEQGIEQSLKAVADLTSDILSRQDQENPLLFTRNGLKLMREGKPAAAERLLRKALQYDSVDIEAALGLASISKKSGDTQGEQRWINRAAIISRKTRQNERADMLFARLPKDMAANPYLAEAGSLLLEEAYAEAAEAFIEAASLQKDNHKANHWMEHPLYAMVARACQFTECPEQTLAELCAAYSRIGRPHIADNLYRRLLNETQESVAPAPESFLARFPRLYEVVEVARFSLQSWRRVKATQP